MDETSLRIMNAAMELIRDKGYAVTTTKDIAKLAQVNECTIFRKFNSKKDIVLSALDEKNWTPNFKIEMFDFYKWELESDLKKLAIIYLEKVPPAVVNLSLGLRAPQIYDEVADKILAVPATFKQVLIAYFEAMYDRGNIIKIDFENTAIMFLSMCFGFAFFKASFEDQLTDVSYQTYIDKIIPIFIKGIIKVE